ncbi:MAG TPA: cellulose biosynthesis cyclic di-GMP-binding regulatory protein BcsB [Usitatibacter sp.]|nr:cellulose biosynthesis cyclic di-GMP-binding regulatory protein BcsB [Usitatibacter sp.]
MIALQRAAACLLFMLVLPAAPSQAAERRTPFTHFGAHEATTLRGDGASASVGFGSRADELVTRATVRLRYSHSSTLPSAQIQLALNGQGIGTLRLSGEATQTFERELEIDPRLIVGFNQLTFTLVSPGERDAEATLSGTSELGITVQQLVLADELAMWPEPFVDLRDQRRVSVPFVFAAQPSMGTLGAAAVLASWLGHLAQWRGARYPAGLDAPLPGHAIAFAANGERPAFLAGLPPASGAGLRLMTNPADQRSKLLVVIGRDADDLRAAAMALVRGGAALKGAAVQLQHNEPQPPRAAYDAPAMIRNDRPVKLGELVPSPQSLETSGTAPALPPVRVDLRLVPDLSPGQGVPLSLKVRYMPPACVGDAHLDIALDGHVLETFSLPLVAASMEHARDVPLPSRRLQGRDPLEFTFRFSLKDPAQCSDARGHVAKAAVDGDSTIDLSNMRREARLPNLAWFAEVGFPFTRFADLSQTVVVLPEKPAPGDIETMLALMGRMGEATGHPAARVRVAPPDEPALADAELLVIGASARQPLAQRWLDGSMARKVRHNGAGPVASLHGVESPLASGRSVVAVTAIVPDQMLRAVDALDDARLRKDIGGGAAFILPGKVESFAPADTYTVGGGFARTSFLIALIALAALGLVAGVTWRLRR